METSDLVLGVCTPVRAYSEKGRIYTHVTSARILDEFAKHYREVHLCTRVAPWPPPEDSQVPIESSRVDIVGQPFWSTTLSSLPHIIRISLAYLRTCCTSDHIVIRGMCPYIGLLYAFAFVLRRPVCHWIVGNPIATLTATSRGTRVRDVLSLLYAFQDRMFTKCGRWITRGAFVCNGLELAALYKSARTVPVVSTTLNRDELFYRDDTCSSNIIRLLFVGYIRPEKGLEYLLSALGLVRLDKTWDLHIVGASEFSDYRDHLAKLVTELGLDSRVHWEGHVPYGQQLFEHMRRSDVLVLPSLSEGTPRVLVEARANCLPCIATMVGGIPLSVTNGFDAVLVPSKNAPALAQAIQELVANSELRRSLIRNGFESVRHLTVDSFVETLRSQFDV